jgi:hypothetical protein
MAKYVWCLHCETVSLKKDWEVQCIYPDGSKGTRCPIIIEGYGQCDGTVINIWEWEDLKRYHDEYPEVPVIGKKYPLY